jgi:hypothetical protein
LNVLEDTPPFSHGEVIERNKTEMPDWFVPAAKGVFVPSDELLRAASDCLGSRRPLGWDFVNRDTLEKHVGGGQTLFVRRWGGLWTVERYSEWTGEDEALVYAVAGIPIFAKKCQAAMRLAESFTPTPPDSIGWLHWIPTYT